MLIDSNIIVYALNLDSSKNKKARIYLESNVGNFSIAHQNMLEVIRVLTHKNFLRKVSLQRVLKEVSAIAETCNVIAPKETTIYLMVDIIKKYSISGNQIFDAYLAATAISNKIYTIVTDNEKDFKKIKEIRVINPFKTPN